MVRKLLAIGLSLFIGYASAQSGLHAKWMSDDEIIYYDRSGTIWNHNLQTNKRNEVLKGSQPAPNPAETGTYAIRTKTNGKSSISIVSTSNAERINASEGIPEERQAFHPIWSNDGSMLAFHAENGRSVSTLYIYDYEKKSLNSHLEEFTVGAPSFFSNNDILITKLTDDGSTLIRYEIGGKVTELLKAEHKIFFSDASPDGKTIAFSYKATGNLDIWLLDIDSGKLTQLTDTPYDEYSPRWSPSGDRFVYFAEIGGQYPALVMDVDGKNNVRITK